MTIIKRETSPIQYEMFRKSLVPLFGVPNKKEIQLVSLFFMLFYRIKPVSMSHCSARFVHSSVDPGLLRRAILCFPAGKMCRDDPFMSLRFKASKSLRLLRQDTAGSFMA